MGSWDIGEKVAKKPEKVVKKLEVLILKTLSFVHDHALDIIFISGFVKALSPDMSDKRQMELYWEKNSRVKGQDLYFVLSLSESDMSNESTFTKLQNCIKTISKAQFVDKTRGL